MNAKIFFIVTVLAMLMAWPVSCQTSSGQDINQNASNVFQGTAANSDITQSNVQNANQAGSAASGIPQTENASPRNGALAANIPPVPNASPSGQAGTVGGSTGAASNQSVSQNASQTVSIQNYISNQPSTPLTSEQRTVITSSTEQFLTSYPTSSMFIMPVSDLDTLVPQNSASFFVLDVSRQNAWSSPVPSLNVVRIPLPSVVSRLSEIPVGKAIVVVSDNQIDSAVAMTLLRMYGYNAWMAQTGACLPAGLAASGAVAQGQVTGYSGTTQSGSTTISNY